MRTGLFWTSQTVRLLPTLIVLFVARQERRGSQRVQALPP